MAVGRTELPAYHDPRYKCEMAILRFDSDRPNPRYEAWIEQIREELLSAPVICRTAQPFIWDNEPLHANQSRETDRSDLISA